MGLSRTVFEINGDFSRKFNFPGDEWVPLEFGISARCQNLESRLWFSTTMALYKFTYLLTNGATGPRKKFDDIISRLDRTHERDGRTDGHRTTAKRPRLRIASRGRNLLSQYRTVTWQRRRKQIQDNVERRISSQRRVWLAWKHQPLIIIIIYSLLRRKAAQTSQQ